MPNKRAGGVHSITAVDRPKRCRVLGSLRGLRPLRRRLSLGVRSRNFMLGEKLLIKIWETLTRDGIGGLASPWQIRRQGFAHNDVRRQEVLALAQAGTDAEAIRQGRKVLSSRGELSDTPAVEHVSPVSEEAMRVARIALSRAAGAKESADRLQQEVNLAKAIIFAEEEAAARVDDTEVADEPIDPDWFTRWRQSAQEVRSEQLQRLWARTLAGEAKSPGTYSLRTLDFLRNLTPAEAKSIEHVTPFIFSGFLPKFENIDLEKEGLDFGFLLDLEDMGFLTGHSGLGLQKTIASQSSEKYLSALVNNNKALVLHKDDPNFELNLPGAALTRIGKEVLTLGQFSSNPEYLKKVAEALKKEGLTVKVGDWIPRQNGNGHVQGLVPI